MIEMFVAVTILIVLVAVAIMAVTAAPWWVGLFSISILALAIHRLMRPPQPDEEDE